MRVIPILEDLRNLLLKGWEMQAGHVSAMGYDGRICNMGHMQDKACPS